MKTKLIALVVFLVAACAGITSALQSPTGQLFCRVQTEGGGSFIVGLVDAEATALAPPAAPVVVVATGAAKIVVDAECAMVDGVATSPPADVANTPQVAISTPKA